MTRDHMQNNEAGFLLTTHTKIFNMIKDLCVRAKTIQFQEENTGETSMTLVSAKDSSIRHRTLRQRGERTFLLFLTWHRSRLFTVR